MRSRLLGLACAVAMSTALCGCGLHPLYADYGPDSGSQQIFRSIYVEPIDGEVAGYEMRNSLIDLLQEWPNLFLDICICFNHSVEH